MDQGLPGMESEVLQSHPKQLKNCSKILEALGKASFLSSSLRMVPNLSFLAKIFRIAPVSILWKKLPYKAWQPQKSISLVCCKREMKMEGMWESKEPLDGRAVLVTCSIFFLCALPIAVSLPGVNSQPAASISCARLKPMLHPFSGPSHV